MTKKSTIHIEPLDEGYVATIGNKRKAMTFDQLREWVASEAITLLLTAGQAKSDCMISFTLDTDIPRSA